MTIDNLTAALGRVSIALPAATAPLPDVCAQATGNGNAHDIAKAAPAPQAKDVVSAYFAVQAQNVRRRRRRRGRPLEDFPNLLEFWQALCLEFGLVADPANPSTTDLPPLPKSKTKARALLHAKAHVNLVDYIRARDKHTSASTDAVVYGQFAHLVFKNVSALVKYTRGQREAETEARKARKEAKARGEDVDDEDEGAIMWGGRKVYPKDMAKGEGLQPMLRHIFAIRSF